MNFMLAFMGCTAHKRSVNFIAYAKIANHTIKLEIIFNKKTVSKTAYKSL